MKRIFKNEKAIAILRNDFEVDDAYAEPAVLSESIFACFDTQYGWSIGRWWHGFIHAVPFCLFDADLMQSHSAIEYPDSAFFHRWVFCLRASKTPGAAPRFAAVDG